MERKTFPGLVTKADEAQGIVEAVWAVMGNVDEGLDIIHPGAFTKTFAERGLKVRVLDQHQTDSVLRVLGHPEAFRELSRDELPEKIKALCPDAIGGAWSRVKFNMKTENGKDVFHLLHEGDVDEWSFGYDVMDHDFSKATKDDQEVTVRNLRTLKLWEISPVIWGMNSATSTTGAKQKEQKPWDVFPEDEQYCVYKVDEEGNPTGDSLGCHPTEPEAQAQIAALHANVDEDDGKQMTEEADSEIVPDEEGPFLYVCTECGHEMESTKPDDVACPECGSPMKRVEQAEAEKDAADVTNLSSPEKIIQVETFAKQYRDFIEKCNIPPETGGELQMAIMTHLQQKAGRVLAQRNAEKLVTALSTIIAILEDAGIDIPGFEKLPQAKPPEDDDAPDKQAAIETSDVKQAGPDGDPPTSDELILLEIQRARIALIGIDVED